MNQSYTTIPNDDSITQTVVALQANGFTVEVVKDKAEAKTKTLSLIPKGAEVLTVTSKTLDDIGVRTILNDSGDYTAVYPQLTRITDQDERRKLGAAPDFVIGSVHAITQDGRVMIVSATGSQLAPYVNGATHVIWVVGAQKIVKDLDQARARIKEYIFPLEDKRSLAVYGINSSINNELVIHRGRPGRITIILVKEALGF